MAPMQQMKEQNWAFVTPSYSGDYQRCLLLCRSMDALLSGNWTHYIVVDRPHLVMFRHLQGPRRHVLVTDDVLPGKMRLLFHMPFAGGRSVWWSKTAGLSIGWHLQQMVKIGIATQLSEDGLAYCDSDTFFLRPFDVGKLTHGEKFRLFRSPHASKPAEAANPSYTQAALQMLDLPGDGEYHGYVDNMVTWRRLSVLGLQHHLAEKNQGLWQRAFRNRLRVSEYNIYGLYVDHIEKSGETHFHSPQTLCKTHWAREAMNADQVQRFCDNLAPGMVMVGIQSFAGIEVALLNQQFEKALNKGQLA
jgi:hypothetical protein